MRPSPSFVSDSVCSSDWHLYLKRTSNAAYQFGASLVLMDFLGLVLGGMQRKLEKEGCFVPKRKVGRQKKSEKELTHRTFKSCHFSWRNVNKTDKRGEIRVKWFP